MNSRQAAELAADGAAERLRQRAGAPVGSGPDAIAAYRGGYLPEDRRRLEADLREGRLLGVAATSALELGIDVRGLDAVLRAAGPAA